MRTCRETFLQNLQKLAHEYNVLTIYDEVMTGLVAQANILLVLRQILFLISFVCQKD